MRVDHLQLRNVVTKRFVSPRLPAHQEEYAKIRKQKIVGGGSGAGLLRKSDEDPPVFYQADAKKAGKGDKKKSK